MYHRLKSEIAGCKVEFLVKAGVIGDMHLSIPTCDASVAIKHKSGVVVKSRRPTFKHARNHDHIIVAARRNIFQ